MAMLSNYLENKVIDWLLRGQTFTPPTPLWVALFTATPSAAGGGTEVSGGSYTRVSLTTSGLTIWAGTQSTGSTTASSGTGGVTSNNNIINFGTTTASWGTVTSIGIFDASTAGNLLFWGPLTTSLSCPSGASVSFAAAAIALTIT
jgi:hypothetical protein